jgi:hypothetical protein
MSAKFKAGDMVELLDGHYGAGLRAGMVGTIVEYLGAWDRPIGRIYNAWAVTIHNRDCAINENFLKLIPGGSESRKAGDWDLCPWSPHRYKNPVVEPEHFSLG